MSGTDTITLHVELKTNQQQNMIYRGITFTCPKAFPSGLNREAIAVATSRSDMENHVAASTTGKLLNIG
jgi:hypothetical protein